MVTNFEEYTEELTPEEKKLIPLLIAGFQSRTKANPIKGKDICKSINAKQVIYGLKHKFTDVRLRKLSNFIRCRSIIPLIATSAGYYVSYDLQEIQKQILSLNERADAIVESAKGLEKFIS